VRRGFDRLRFLLARRFLSEGLPNLPGGCALPSPDGIGQLAIRAAVHSVKAGTMEGPLVAIGILQLSLDLAHADLACKLRQFSIGHLDSGAASSILSPMVAGIVHSDQSLDKLPIQGSCEKGPEGFIDFEHDRFERILPLSRFFLDS
jgi:hypothetical protein